ncbi:MAG: hypothetical protein IPH18_00440 [Chitinophagaceae bacterium]|nr:hypothetical protein [Chitinophagaceae bacterium]MBK8951517.1 hypothetical protein [Chitinophagaceae bacterium]
MKRKSLFFIVFIVISSFSYAQNPLEAGAEYIRSFGKGYNHTKLAARGEPFNSSKSSFSAGITYQLASSKSYSVSRGLGLYIGYRYSFTSKVYGNSPFAGARILFSLENFEGQTSRNSLFITPWAEAGYHFLFADRYYLAPSVGYGFTKKFSKDYHSLDEDNGGRIIPSLSAGYRFNL